MTDLTEREREMLTDCGLKPTTANIEAVRRRICQIDAANHGKDATMTMDRNDRETLGRLGWPQPRSSGPKGPEYRDPRCSTCHGTGEAFEPTEPEQVPAPPCPTCHGSGKATR